MASAPFCPDPRAIPSVPDVTQLPSEEESRAQREEEKQASEIEKKQWEDGIKSVDRDEGFAAFVRDYEKSDAQQRVFIDAIAASPDHGFRVLQGIAAAGSGKTRCVVLGVAKLFYDGRISHTQIVCTTFTNKAGRELVERLCRYIPKHSVFTQLRVGTFHSGRISGQGLGNIGRKIDWRKKKNDLLSYLRLILDRPKGADPTILNVHGVVARNLAEKLGGATKAAKSYSDLISNKFEPWGMRSPAMVRDYLNQVDAQGGPNTLDRSERERWTAIAKAKEMSSLEDVYPQFPGVWGDALRLKDSRQEFTYNDLLGDYLEAADKDAVKVFITDESQDNSWVQLQIALRAARAGNGTMVLCGDGRQGIYRFRGADPTIFQFAGSDFGADQAQIGTNYRSGYWIVEAGNVVCMEGNKQAAWAIGDPAIAGRRNADGTPFQGKVEVDHYSTSTKELIDAGLAPPPPDEPSGKKKKQWKPISGEVPAARAIATQIAATAERLDDGTMRLTRSTAIITRTNAPLGAFELALSRFRIPCVFAGGRSNFMSSGPIVTMLRLLALAGGVIEDPKLAAEMLYKVLRDPGGRFYGDRFSRIYRTKRLADPSAREQWKRADGPPGFVDTVEKFWSRGLIRSVEELGKLQGGKWSEGAEEFCRELEPLCEADWDEAPRLAADILRNWEFLQSDAKEETDEAVEDEETVDDDGSDSYYQSLADIAATFESYAEFMAYVARAKDTQSVGEGVKKEAVVTLTTGHRCKGLEWHTVHLVAPAKVWPHMRASSSAEQEEERRLYYVGVTRAADELHVHSYGEGTSPLTWEVFQNAILPRMQRARIEAERAKLLAEVNIQEVDGPDGRPRFAVFRDGVRLLIGGMTTWATYDLAVDAYLTQDAAPPTPLFDRVERFLRWLWEEQHLLLANTVRERTRSLEALIADEQVGEMLGWSTLESLFPNHPGDIEIRTRSDRRVGYLLRGQPTAFQGFLELRPPWTDYVVRPIPPDAVPSGYGTRFVDNTFALIEARYAYSTTLPGLPLLGRTLPEEPTTDLPHPLIEDGPVAAEVVGALSVDDPLPTTTPAAAPSPLEVTLSGTAPHEVAPGTAPRRSLPVSLPLRDETDSWSVLVISPQGVLLAVVNLAHFREAPLLERAFVQYVNRGVYTLYRVMSGSVGKDGRLMGALQQILVGSRQDIAGYDYASAAADLTDDPVRRFLGSPDIRQQDQILWESCLSRPFKMDFGRLTDTSGNVLTRISEEDVLRLLRSGWFYREQPESGSFRWNDEAITAAYSMGGQG